VQCTRRSASFRDLVRYAKDGDEAERVEAFQTLLTIMDPDIRRIVGQALNRQPVLIRETISYARIRLYVQMEQFEVDPGWVHGDCERNFRRWASKVIRNYAANVRRYGLDRARDWLFPVGPTRAQRNQAKYRPQVVLVSDEATLSALHHKRGGE